MSKPVPIRAKSNYRQVRLTFTQESTGRCSYRISAKGLNQQWDEHQVLVSDSVVCPLPLDSTEAVIAALLVILAEQVLPESHR